MLGMSESTLASLLSSQVALGKSLYLSKLQFFSAANPSGLTRSVCLVSNNIPLGQQNLSKEGLAECL